MRKEIKSNLAQATEQTNERTRLFEQQQQQHKKKIEHKKKQGNSSCVSV